jgi:hypothetical protein
VDWIYLAQDRDQWRASYHRHLVYHFIMHQKLRYFGVRLSHVRATLYCRYMLGQNDLCGTHNFHLYLPQLFISNYRTDDVK